MQSPLTPLIPNIEAMKRVLDEAQSIALEIQEINMKMLQAKTPEEALALEDRLKALMKRAEDFKNHYWGEGSNDEPTEESEEQPTPEQSHKE